MVEADVIIVAANSALMRACREPRKITAVIEQAREEMRRAGIDQLMMEAQKDLVCVTA